MGLFLYGRVNAKFGETTEKDPWLYNQIFDNFKLLWGNNQW